MLPPETFAQRLVRVIVFALAIFLYIDLEYGLSNSLAATAVILSSLVHGILFIWLRHYACRKASGAAHSLSWPGISNARSKFHPRLVKSFDVLFAVAYSVMAVLLRLHFYDSPTNTALFNWKVAGIAVSVLQA